MSHAVLSPSAASRWLACTPSARLEQKFPDTSGEAAKEGTLAHALAELLISRAAGKVDEVTFEQVFMQIEDSQFYDHSMLDYCEEYASYVVEQYHNAQKHTKDALLFLEQKLDLTDYIPEGFGTGDVIIIADGTLSIIDLKYGKGVPVTAVDNNQMKLYSLGALREFDYMYDIQNVHMTIYQPRLDSITDFSMSVLALKQWAEEVLKPKAELAFAGKGFFNPGSHCQFCKAKASCKAFAEHNLELARYDFADTVLLSDEEVADILSKAKMFTGWLSAVQDHALAEAVNNGKQWPGYKLVEGRSNRVYSDEDKVAKKLIKNGIKEDVIYTKKLLGITAMEKEITKAKFNDLLSDLVIKPEGKPTLVPQDDKRPELNSTASAIKDFANI